MSRKLRRTLLRALAAGTIVLLSQCALSHSTAHKNGVLDGTGPVKTVYNGGSLRLLDGAAPANGNAAESGVLGVAVPLPNPLFGAAASGQSTANAISSATITSSITASYARIVATGDTGAAVTTTQPRVQCSVGTSGTDIVLNTTTLVAGGTFTVTSLVYQHPA